MTRALMEQIVTYVTCFAAVGLFFATCALVWVTIHHARSAERMAAAADRLGEIVERRANELAEVAELSTLVNVMTSDYLGPTYVSGLKAILSEVDQRRSARAAQRQK